MDVMNSVVKTFARGLPTDLIIKDLSSNSRHLLELDGLLRVKLGKIDIYSFYELLPMAPLKSPVVERHSALLNLPNEIEQIGLDADHRAMCRPVDRNDFIYETIAQRIMSIMNRQLDKTQYSKDLTEMTNAFASRQIENISILTKDLHESAAGAKMPPAFSTFIQQTLNMHISDQAALQYDHGLEEILKSLPMQKIKGFVECVQSIMKRASSLTDLLLLVERQHEQRKAEARMALERQANETQIQELMAENARLKEALRRGRPRSPSPLWKSGSMENSIGRREDTTTETQQWAKSSSSWRRSRSRSCVRTSAEVALEGHRKNELEEVSHDDGGSIAEYPEPRPSQFKKQNSSQYGQGGRELRRMTSAEFKALMAEDDLTTSGSQHTLFGNVNPSVQEPENRMPRAESHFDGLVFKSGPKQRNHPLIDQPRISGFYSSPTYSDRNPFPLSASNDDASNWPSLLPDATAATSTAEVKKLLNKHTEEVGGLVHQSRGKRLETTLGGEALNGACLDTEEGNNTVEEDKKWGNERLVDENAANPQSPTPQPIGYEAASGISRTNVPKNQFTLEPSSSNPHVDDKLGAPAGLPIQEQENNGKKVNPSEECIAASYEQYGNVELDCAVTAASARRRSPLGIPFRIVKFAFIALRPPAAITDAFRPASLARSSSSMFAKLPFAHSEKKDAKSSEEIETGAEKARTDVSRHENKLSSPDEPTGTSFGWKRVRMESTAADVRLAARLESVAKKREEKAGKAKQTAEDASGRPELKFLNEPIARNSYLVPIVASTPATTELLNKRKVASALMWTGGKLGTPDSDTFDDNDFTIDRAPDHGESIRCAICAHDGLSNRDQSLMLHYTARVAEHTSPTYPRSDVATQVLQEPCFTVPLEDQLERDEAQGGTIIDSRIQMQGLVHKLTRLLEVGQQVMMASPSEE